MFNAERSGVCPICGATEVPAHAHQVSTPDGTFTTTLSREHECTGITAAKQRGDLTPIHTLLFGAP